MKILLSGFEPFRNRKTNQSWEISKKFIGSDNVKVVLLPVSFSKAHRILITELESDVFDLVIMLGETASTSDAVRLERVAINLKDSEAPDNDGVSPDEEEIIKNAPKAYFTGLPLKKYRAFLKGKGYKVKITNSAGSFVCNSVYYNILHYLAEKELPTGAVFVHLPVLTDQVSLEEMEQIIKDIMELASA